MPGDRIRELLDRIQKLRTELLQAMEDAVASGPDSESGEAVRVQTRMDIYARRQPSQAAQHRRAHPRRSNRPQRVKKAATQRAARLARVTTESPYA